MYVSDMVTAPPLDERSVRMVTLDRPAKANALSSEIVEALLTRVETAYSDGTRVLVLSGSGKNFCGGFDFSGYEEQSTGDLLHRFVRIEELLQRLYYAPFITVATIQGAAFGAGADLAVACTYRWGTATARFRFPGFQFGVALGTRRLVNTIGEDCARNILVSNKLLNARQARECGLLTHFVEPEDLSNTIVRIFNDTSSLHSTALQTLLSNTREDSRDRDLSDLVRSVGRPSLHERIARYLNASTKGQ